ncbi:MAG: C-terminal binding protein [Candidatus Omnitrophota bacterium]
MMEHNFKYQILIPDHITPPADIEQEIFGPRSRVIAALAEREGQIPDEVWSESDALIVYDNLRYEKGLLAKLKKCRVIVRAGIGYDNIDIEEAARRDMYVCNIPDYCTDEVADHTIAFLLSIVRGFPGYQERVRENKWDRKSGLTFRLKDKVMGMIGLGRIGSAAALRAKAFGMKIVFYDPYVKEGYDKVLGAERMDSLNHLARVSDVISVHTPLTGETYEMLDEDFFSNVKKGAVFINTARGPVVKLNALENAMKDNIVRASGLDVFSVEPPDDTQSLFVDYKNREEWLEGRLIISPHSAYHSPEGMRELRTKAAFEAKRVLDGEKPRNWVNEW